MLSLCLHLSSLNLCYLISAVIVILFVLDCFINSVLAYFHILHIHCLIISLNWYFVFWGFKRSRCFTHYLNIQLVSEQVHLFWFHYLSVILDPLCVLPWIMLYMLIWMLLIITCHVFVKIPLWVFIHIIMMLCYMNLWVLLIFLTSNSWKKC